MTFPILNDYKAAMSNAKTRFASLDITPQLDHRQNPVFNAVNFAGVFKVAKADGTLMAVKCFIRDIPNLEQRYRAINRFIKKAGSPYFIDLEFHPTEVYVLSKIAGSGEFPVVTMPWIAGRSISTVVKLLCERDNRPALAGLTRAWAKLCLDLLNHGAAHGDLKHDNVIITPEGRLRLIDYDSMFLPELKGLASPLLGGINFQSPARDERHFQADIDHFSMLVMLLSLRALVFQPDLFAQYNNGENIILSRQDFVAPQSSSLLQGLIKSEDFFVADWAKRLLQVCQTGALAVQGIKSLLNSALRLDVAAEKPGAKRFFYFLSAGLV